MSWIIEHSNELMAIVVGLLAVWGALYSLGLIIVKLTPTPKDDQALEEINGIVLMLCKVFGLTPFQGVRK